MKKNTKEANKKIIQASLQRKTLIDKMEDELPLSLYERMSNIVSFYINDDEYMMAKGILSFISETPRLMDKFKFLADKAEKNLERELVPLEIFEIARRISDVEENKVDAKKPMFLLEKKEIDDRIRKVLKDPRKESEVYNELLEKSMPKIKEMTGLKVDEASDGESDPSDVK